MIAALARSPAARRRSPPRPPRGHVPRRAGSVRVPVRPTPPARRCLPAPSASALGGTSSVRIGWAEVSVARQPFRFLLGAPLFSFNSSVRPLAGAASALPATRSSFPSSSSPRSSRSTSASATATTRAAPGSIELAAASRPWRRARRRRCRHPASQRAAAGPRRHRRSGPRRRRPGNPGIFFPRGLERRTSRCRWACCSATNSSAGASA